MAYSHHSKHCIVVAFIKQKLQDLISGYPKSQDYLLVSLLWYRTTRLLKSVYLYFGIILLKTWSYCLVCCTICQISSQELILIINFVTFLWSSVICSGTLIERYLKKKRLKFSLTWALWEGKFQNAIPPIVMIPLQVNFSECFPWQSTQKLLLGILKFQIYT